MEVELRLHDEIGPDAVGTNPFAESRKRQALMDNLMSDFTGGRRRFLKQSFAFSVLAALGSLRDMAGLLVSDPAAAELLMVGDWGYDDVHTAQTTVAFGMRQYVHQHVINAQALLMLRDNWYGELAGGAHSARWKTQFVPNSVGQIQIPDHACTV